MVKLNRTGGKKATNGLKERSGRATNCSTHKEPRKRKQEARNSEKTRRNEEWRRQNCEIWSDYRMGFKKRAALTPKTVRAKEFLRSSARFHGFRCLAAFCSFPIVLLGALWFLL